MQKGNIARSPMRGQTFGNEQKVQPLVPGISGRRRGPHRKSRSRRFVRKKVTSDGFQNGWEEEEEIHYHPPIEPAGSRNPSTKSPQRVKRGKVRVTFFGLRKGMVAQERR